MKTKGKKMEHRRGENGLLPFRTSRVYNIGTKWYFAVREGKDSGPFDDMQTAENELRLFLMDILPQEKQYVSLG